MALHVGYMVQVFSIRVYNSRQNAIKSDNDQIMSI